jgi:hypothetical protein
MKIVPIGAGSRPFGLGQVIDVLRCLQAELLPAFT